MQFIESFFGVFFLIGIIAQLRLHQHTERVVNHDGRHFEVSLSIRRLHRCRVTHEFELLAVEVAPARNIVMPDQSIR